MEQRETGRGGGREGRERWGGGGEAGGEGRKVREGRAPSKEGERGWGVRKGLAPCLLSTPTTPCQATNVGGPDVSPFPTPLAGCSVSVLVPGPCKMMKGATCPTYPMG